MAVAMLVDNPDGSQEMHEKVLTERGLDRTAGGTVHVAVPSPAGGWRVIEMWESVEEASRFLKEQFGPALKAIRFTGQPPQPPFWSVHNYMT